MRQSWRQQDWRHCKWRASLFGHVVHLNPYVPAHQALWMQTYLSTGRKPNVRWRRTPGRPRKTWYCQIWTDVGMSPCNCWDACRLSIVATVEWCNGPKGLCDDDDDDDVKDSHNRDVILQNTIFRRILISRFPYVENLLHFNFADFPVNYIKQFISCFFWCLKQMLSKSFCIIVYIT